jgi:ribulose kinase
VLIVNTEETAALGAALLAGLAAGTFLSLDKAVQSMVSVKERFSPSKGNQKIYNERYKKYVKLYSNLEGLF